MLPFAKLKSKCIKDLNIKPYALNLIEEVGKSLELVGTWGKFLNRTPAAHALRFNKWDLMKLESFCKAKDTVSKIKGHQQIGKGFFYNPKSDRGLISNI